MKAVSNAGKELLEKQRERLVEQAVTVVMKLIETYGGRIGSVLSEEAQKWMLICW